MNSSIPLYIGLSLLGGALIPVSASVSGAMGRHLGNPSLASLIVSVGATLTVLAYTLLTGATHVAPGGLASIRPLQWLAGSGIAFYLLAITYVVPRFGVGNAITLVLAAQIVCSALIDQFALFGAPQKPVDLLRLFGLVVMAIGVMIAQLGSSPVKPGA
jgi:transporter family-2 protein